MNASALSTLLAPAVTPDSWSLERRVRVEAQAHLERYAGALVHAETVLDVGTGPGMTADMIRQRFDAIDIIGLDVIDSIRHDIQLVLYDGRTIPVPDDAFDVSLLQYTLHHCRAPRAVLSECARVTRNSIVVIEEFELDGADPQLEEFKEAATLAALGLPPDLHHQPLERGELETMFEEHALTISHSERLPTRSTRRVHKQLYVLEVP